MLLTQLLFLTSIEQPFAESDALILRKRASELRTAAEKCRENIANGWDSCHVTISFENNREVTIEQTEAYAEELDRRALIKALEIAVKTEGVIGECRCNLFIGAVGRALDIPYFRDRVEDARLANEMYNFIESAIGSSASGWKKVSPEEAQSLANEGRFVIGVAKNKNLNDHGHIAIVVPIQLEHAINPGNSGPWVRDSKYPLQSYRASMRFGNSVVAPIWAYYKE